MNHMRHVKTEREIATLVIWLLLVHFYVSLSLATPKRSLRY